MKIYKLTSSYDDICSFIQDYEQNQESIMGLSREQRWKKFINYAPIHLALRASDSGKKNYKFDFSSALNPFLVFSENAMQLLKPILAPRGQFLEVVTASKRKKFIGYYPTNFFSAGILDLEKSEYVEYPNGLLIRKPVLIKQKIADEYLFTIEEDISRIFVTEKFKQIIEDNKLIGFEFSAINEVELSNL